MKRAARQLKIDFPLLSDDGSKVIEAYGIRNEEASAAIPHPVTFLVDREGVVRQKLFREGYRERHSVAELIEAAGKLPKRN